MKLALKLFAAVFASLFLTVSIAAENAAPAVTYRIKPSETNASIVRADAPHLVMFRQEPGPQLSHIRVLTMEPPRLAGLNPYGIGISNVNTPDNFSFMFGSGYAALP